MLASIEKIDYLSKDYEAFRTDMINRIPRKFSEWTDYSSSDAGIVILELLAYGLDILSYYQDRNANETLLPTATQRQNVIDLCSLIGYKLREAAPSKALVVFQVSIGTNVTIPKGFQISTEGTDLEEAIVFELDEDLVIPSGNSGLEQSNGEYIYSVTATQGISVSNDIIGSSDGTVSQRFKLKYPNCIDGSLSLYVNEGAGFQLWTDVTNRLVQDTEDGKHYWRETDANEYTWIVFGGGADGKVPVAGLNNIQASYRIGGGSDGNIGANKINQTVSSLARVVRVFNPEAALGGLDKESIEEAKRNAPKFLKTSNRAVTKTDYEILALKVAGVAKSYAKQDSTIYNLVHVYIFGESNLDIEDLKVAVYNYLDGLKTITTQIQIHEGVKENIQLTMNITIDSNYVQDAVRTSIIEVLANEFDMKNREFGQGEPLYKLYTLLGPTNGITGLSIAKFTNIPTVNTITQSGSVTWSDIEITSSSNTAGTWKVTMTSTTAFSVAFDTTGEFNGGQVTKGSGTLSSLFTSSDGAIKFTISGSGCQVGDNWTFKTKAYLADIAIDNNEIIALATDNITLNITGGMA